MFKALGDPRTRMKELNSFLRKASKPIIASQRENILNSSTGGEAFKVYKKGKLFAETSRSQLAKSVGLVKYKPSRKLTTGFKIGPRQKGVWKNPNKGGWFGWWLEFGTKYRKTGKGKINIRKKPFTNTDSTAVAVKFAINEVMNKESKAIQQTMKRFQKLY